MGGGDRCGVGMGMMMTSSGKDIYSQLCFLHKLAVCKLQNIVSHLYGWPSQVGSFII